MNQSTKNLIQAVPAFCCDGNFNASALFQPRIVTVFVSLCVFDTELPMQLVGPLKSDLCLFRLARAWRRNDFVDCSGHSGAWLL